MKHKINEKVDNGYSLDLGKVIDDSFEIFKKTFLISGLGYLLVGIVMAVLYFFLFIVVFGVADMANFVVELEVMKTTSAYIVGMLGFTVVYTALIAPLNAGFLKLCYLAKKNQTLEIGAIFEYYKGKYAKDIIVGSIIISFAAVSLSTLFDLVGLSFLGLIVQLILTWFTILFLPLVIFGNQNFGEAIEKSVKLVAKQPFHIFVALVIAIIGVLLGIIALCIGILFTTAYWPAMTFALYDNIIGVEEESIIDEIGTSEFNL